MLLIDSSAWIDHLKHADSPSRLDVVRAVREGTAATTDQVLLEVLAGASDARRLAAWQGMLNACEFVPQLPYVDAESAARVYRTCRRAGETPRALADCLIAAIAIRTSATVLHRDRDFDVISRHSTLQVVSA